MSSTGSSTTIFVGSSADLAGLAAPSVAAPLLSEGDIGLYGHMEGIVNAYNDGTEQVVLSEWAGTGAGLTETTQDSPMAVIQFTVANTGATPLVIPVGQIVSSSTGVQFQVVEQPDQVEDWSAGGAGDGSLGMFTIPAGQSVTLTAQALVDGPSGNLLDNQLTNIGIAGATITGSTLQLAAQQWSAGTVTLHNGSTASQIIWEGTALTGTNGSYHVGVDAGVSGFVSTNADGSAGYYVLAAGASLSVPIGSNDLSASTPSAQVLAELATNAAANSITGGALPAGVTITASSALTTQGDTTPSSQDRATSYGGNTGFFSDAQIQLWTTNQGYVPTEANVNTTNNYIWTARDLSNWEAYVDGARSFGVLNLAPMLSEFETADFATSAATSYVRAAALYSGGIAFDMPSWFFLAREPAYQQSTYEEIRWANQNGLRSSITISPESSGDENFLADTQKMVAMLAANGALPTEIVVKDEGILGTTDLYSTTDPNSLNNVAAWLGTLHLTPSNSESGLEATGTTSRPDALMTGVQSTVAVSGAAASLPFAVSQLFAETGSTVATLTVTLSAPSLGRLGAGAAGGSVSSNGATFTATGTMAQLTAALQALSFTAAAGAEGNASLVTTVKDAAGTITGTTALSVHDELWLSGMPATLSTNMPLQAAQGFSLSSADPSAQLTTTISLSDPTLAEFWNTGTAVVSADGDTLTLSGTAATIQNAVRQLVLDTAPYAAGTETLTISVTDGIQTVSASTSMAVSPDVLIAATNIPQTTTIAAGDAGEPFADVLVAFAADPGGVFSGSITLSAGAARFGATSAGSLSANGLTYSITGTAAQIQAALRQLTIVVPGGSGTGTQTLTIDAEGYTKTVTLKVTAADTVMVGAPDATLGGYASSAVAAPLLAAGNVGLVYDYNGVTASSIGGTLGAVQHAWSGTADGVFGYTLNTLVAQQTITVRNTGSGTLTIPVGTIARTAAGVQFQVVQSTTGNANWIAGSTGDGSLGAFQVAAGATLTLTVEATTPGSSGDVATNAITSLVGISAAAVVASQASVIVQEYATGTVTLTNTSASYVTVNEGTVLSNGTGSYVIGNDPTAAYYSARYADNSAGVYYIAPGGSTTVPIYGSNALSGSAATMLTQVAAQTTTSSNTLTSTALPAGIVIAGSSAITVTGPTAAQVATYGGWGPNTGVLSGRGYGGFYTNEGLYPTEANTNLSLSTNFTQADLAAWKSYVDSLRSVGILNVAPALASSGNVLDISTSDATAALRSAALYGGGIDIDTVPASILASSQQLTATIDDIKWAAQNGLRTTLVLRAYGDNTFGDESKALLGKLAAAGALPSQVTVLGSPTSPAIPAAELAPAVAQYAASLGLAPSTSESGLENGSGSTMDMIATGVQTTEATNGPQALDPYAALQLFALNASETVTATVALTDATKGTLRSASGTVSADGSLVTVSGTAATVQADLAAIQYVPTSGAAGTVALHLAITDANGTIAGQTRISSNSAGLQSLPLSVAALPGASTIGSFMGVAVAVSAGQNDQLVGANGTAISNNFVAATGSPAAVAGTLSGIAIAPGSVGDHPNLYIQLAGTPESFTDSNPGHDHITSGGNNGIDLGSGSYTVQAGGGDTVSAGSGSVFATGSAAFTFLGGSGAADTVMGGAGGGSFSAGTGGHSFLSAGTGAAVLRAAGGNDTLVGGGHAALYGAANGSTLMLLTSGDTAIGAAGSVIIGPSSGTATVQLGDGNETVLGAAGSMAISAGTGTATIDLGSGSASVAGGAGTTMVIAGANGHATVSGGLGQEIVSLQKGTSTGAAVVFAGFDPSLDRIMVSGYGTAAGSQAVASQVSTSAGTLLTLSDGASIMLQGVSHLNSSSVLSG